MANERDFNDVLDDIFLSEQAQHQASYEEGLKAGSAAGNPEGYHMGYHRGADIGRELGYYLGVTEHHLTLAEHTSAQYSEKIIQQLTKVKELIDSFPRINSEDHDIVQMLDVLRAQYKKTCALLKIPSNNPYGSESFCQAKMDTSHLKVREQLERITKFLTPLLPLANCHMVEFLTENHWNRYIPKDVRTQVEAIGFSDAVESFWKAACDWKRAESSALSAFINAARSHCIATDEEICLSTDELKRRILTWGGQLEPEIKVTEFMSSKKGYEVQTMSSLVASLHSICSSSHCVDVGGGRGQLPTVLALGYRIPGLTVDCDEVSLAAGMKRDRLIQKQWHAIAKKVTAEASQTHEKCERNTDGLHRYVKSFVTDNTDLSGLVRNNFPEHSKKEVKLLLTGLHTCGDLGPSSLRVFTRQPDVAAALNVPCCYHLLTEVVDDGALWHPAERVYIHGDGADAGFPMSEFLRGYQLGRNARMLAAQSIDRVTHQRQLPSRSLFYRALLQVIIKKHLQTTVPEGKLKRLSPKCKNFTEYLKEASAILKLNLEVLTENNLLEFSVKYESVWEKLVLFYLLRLCLAQVIESVILLDRVLFLRELGYSDVYLVRLFDPVLSPRCHGIVVKREYK